MSEQKVAILGNGTAGRRFFQLLSEMNVDSKLLSRRVDLAEIDSRNSSPSGWSDFNHIIIASETSSHHEMLLGISSSSFKGKVLIEKPGYVRESRSFNQSLDVRVSYNLRYLEGIWAIKEMCQQSRPLNLGIVCHSHLTQWRKDHHREGQYSRLKASGGGALLDLSHEIDFARLILGIPLVVSAQGGRLGKVTQDSDDSWGILFGYEDGSIATINLSIISHRQERQLTLVTQEKEAKFDLLTGVIEFSDGPQRQLNRIQDTYKAMLLDWVFGNSRDKLPTLEENSETLELIARIRTAAT